MIKAISMEPFMTNIPEAVHGTGGVDMKYLLIFLLSISALNLTLQAQSWKRYQVTFKYDPAFRGGPNEGGPKMNWGKWTKYLNIKEFETAAAWIDLPPLEKGAVDSWSHAR